jgi:hypothetical protein
VTDNIPSAEPIDVRNNPESRAAEADRSSQVARASDGGAPPKVAPDAGELPETVEGGAADGSPVAGVTISEEDRATAVEPDQTRTEQEGPTAGHA